MLWRDLSRSAVDCGAAAEAGAAAGAGTGGVGLAPDGFGRSPLRDSEARRSPPLMAGVDAV